MGCDVKTMCETQANLLMYYMRYNKDADFNCAQWLIDQGIDAKHADKNQMQGLHYTMINFNANMEHIKFFVDNGADINSKMAQDIDCLDLIIYTQNMKNANFNRILRIVRYLVEEMNCEPFDLRKLNVINAILVWDRLLMCKLRSLKESE